jgi:cell division cycle 14
MHAPILKKQKCHCIFNVPLSKRACSVYLSQNNAVPNGVGLCSVFETPEITYDAFCDDFGPMNFTSIVTFVELLDDQIRDGVSNAIVYSVQDGPRALTNAAFLLGAYMLLTFDATPESVAERFAALQPELFEAYRDATYSEADFGLTLLDCWGGMYRAMEHGWLARPTRRGSALWGRIDANEYAQYDNPLNADLHEVVPGKFVALRGPLDLGAASYRDDRARRGLRHFSPGFYVPILRELGVSAVVRLNEAAYDPAAFAAAGMEHVDLPFPDCGLPPPAVVSRFLSAAEAAPGAVAVHCMAGLGRTGTLIALYMMKHLRFSAREAMGWLRVMRPGSVIGEQQHYLCEVERGVQARRTAGRGAGAQAGALAAQVAEGAARRGAARGVGADAARAAAAAAAGTGVAELSATRR